MSTVKIVGGVFFASLVAVLIYAGWTGDREIPERLIGLLITFGAGAFGGRGLAASRKQRQEEVKKNS